MKNLIVLAVALASVNAFATKARFNALATSPHLIDTQTVYSQPADMFFVGGDYVNMESGLGTATGRNGQNNAEGMVVRSYGDAKAGLAIGHMSTLATQLRSATALVPTQFTLNGGNALLQQNPIELFYGMKMGDLAWAGTLVYSKSESKVSPNEKEDTMGLRGGFRMGAMDGRLAVGLSNNYQNDTDGKFKGTLGIQAAFGYWLDTTYLFADLTVAGFKVENAGGAETQKFDTMVYGVSATNSMKKDGTEFFYTLGLKNTEQKNNATLTSVETKTTTLAFPVTMGLEVDATSWMAFRGSITQAVPILSSTKTSAATTTAELNPVTNNTTFAAGLGLKFNKLVIDGTILTGGTQAYNSAALLAQVGATYMF